jgi:hypothetical protein
MNPPALGIFLEDRPPVAVIMPAVEVRTSSAEDVVVE